MMSKKFHAHFATSNVLLTVHFWSTSHISLKKGKQSILCAMLPSVKHYHSVASLMVEHSDTNSPGNWLRWLNLARSNMMFFLTLKKLLNFAMTKSYLLWSSSEILVEISMLSALLTGQGCADLTFFSFFGRDQTLPGSVRNVSSTWASCQAWRSRTSLGPLDRFWPSHLWPHVVFARTSSQDRPTQLSHSAHRIYAQELEVRWIQIRHAYNILHTLHTAPVAFL